MCFTDVERALRHPADATDGRAAARLAGTEDPGLRVVAGWGACAARCPVGFVRHHRVGAARFRHAGFRVGFVVPAVGFGLGADARLRRLARAVRFLDIGGIAVAEPAGLRTVRSGLREKHADDDHPTLAAAAAFDARYAAAATPP